MLAGTNSKSSCSGKQCIQNRLYYYLPGNYAGILTPLSNDAPMGTVARPESCAIVGKPGDIKKRLKPAECS